MHSQFIYYVYAYIRTRTTKNGNAGTPYYIGKGCRGRAFGDHGKRVTVPKDKTKIVFLEKNLSEVGALALEKRMIEWYGRQIEGGILKNISEGGSSLPRYRSEDHKKNISQKLKDFCKKTNRGMVKNGGTKGTRWVNNGVKNMCIDKNQTLPESFFEGKITQTSGENNSVYGKKIFNNGVVVSYFTPGEEPLGWSKGRIKKKKEPKLLF